MKKIGTLLPKDPARLLRWAAEQPTVAVTCPACDQTWERHGAKEPEGFDCVCPACFDRGVRAGTFRRTLAPADRWGFLTYSGFPSTLTEPYVNRAGNLGVKAREALGWNAGSWSIGLVGPTNTGKSMIAAELCWRLRANYPVQKFIRADRLVSILFGRLGDEERQRTDDQVVSAQILVLDDLGWGNRGAGMDAIFELLAIRHSEGRPTIWTSNTEPTVLARSNAPMLRRMLEGRLVRFDESHEWTKT